MHIFLFQKNEDDILEEWIKHHAKIVCYNNITIVDHNSTDNSMRILQKYEKLGVNVRKFIGEYKNKGKILTEEMNKYRQTVSLLIPLDADEFIITNRDGKISKDIDAIKEDLQELVVNPQHARYYFGKIYNYSNTMLYPELHNLNTFYTYSFFTDENNIHKKCFFNSAYFISTDMGNHYGSIKNGISKSKTNLFHKQLGLLHFQMRGFNHFNNKNSKNLAALCLNVKGETVHYGKHWHNDYKISITKGAVQAFTDKYLSPKNVIDTHYDFFEENVCLAENMIEINEGENEVVNEDNHEVVNEDNHEGIILPDAESTNVSDILPVKKSGDDSIIDFISYNYSNINKNVIFDENVVIQEKIIDNIMDELSILDFSKALYIQKEDVIQKPSISKDINTVYSHNEVMGSYINININTNTNTNTNITTQLLDIEEPFISLLSSTQLGQLGQPTQPTQPPQPTQPSQPSQPMQPSQYLNLFNDIIPDINYTKIPTTLSTPATSLSNLFSSENILKLLNNKIHLFIGANCVDSDKMQPLSETAILNNKLSDNLKDIDIFNIDY